MTNSRSKYWCFALHLFIALQFGNAGYGQDSTKPVWQPDDGRGNYQNPVIHADYSDPDVIRVGDDYYMVSSSFCQVPGLPILHSKDLVNWEIIAHALPKLHPRAHFDTVRPGGGVWAPSIRFHKGEFYIYYPDPDFGIYLLRARNIRGPWSDPVLVEGGKGLIDPCPLWDKDGKAWLVHAYAGSRAGIKSILVVKPLSSDGAKVAGPGVMVYDGHALDPTIEGPKFYTRNGYYYIFAPAGGVSTGWQTVLRSRNILGPYERKVVMDQGKSMVNGPHQGAWVTTPLGEDWFLHFQDKDAYGRVVHLQPMHWNLDWPVIGIDADGDGKGEPVVFYRKPKASVVEPKRTPATSDEFNSVEIGRQWQWEANPSGVWALPTSMGTLRMFSVYHADSARFLYGIPDILGQKIPAERFRVQLKMVFNPKHDYERFGLTVLGESYGYLAVEKRTDGLFAVYRKGITENGRRVERELGAIRISSGDCVLEMEVRSAGICRFGVSADNSDMQYFPEETVMKAGKWVGARIGMFCHRSNRTNDAGYADIDWFRVSQINH